MRRGDIVALKAAAKPRGREQRGARYAVVLQSDELPGWATVIVAPTSTTTPGARFRPEVRVRGRTTRVMVDQLACVDRSRLGAVVGRLEPSESTEIERSLRHVLGLF